MTSSGLRETLKWIHIVLGLVIMCYVYSPFGKETLFKIVVRFAVIPAITFTGIWIWKFRAFNKFFRIGER